MADIELVIKIDEDAYKATCNECMLPPDVENVVQGIKNGILLSKGHGRLIDATILRMGFVVSARFNGTWNLGKTRILSHIDDANTIIEADNH